MTVIVRFEGAYVTWKGQVRFMRFVEQPNTINTIYDQEQLIWHVWHILCRHFHV